LTDGGMEREREGTKVGREGHKGVVTITESVDSICWDSANMQYTEISKMVNLQAFVSTCHSSSSV